MFPLPSIFDFKGGQLYYFERFRKFLSSLPEYQKCLESLNEPQTYLFNHIETTEDGSVIVRCVSGGYTCDLSISKSGHMRHECTIYDRFMSKVENIPDLDWLPLIRVKQHNVDTYGPPHYEDGVLKNKLNDGDLVFVKTEYKILFGKVTVHRGTWIGEKSFVCTSKEGNYILTENNYQIIKVQ